MPVTRARIAPTAPKRRKAAPVLVATEHQEQSLLFQWADAAKGRWPELGLLFAIPNAGGYKGGFKSNVRLVMRAKREGVRKGVPDVMLPVPRGRYHGLFVEMKRTRVSMTSAEQRAWLAALAEQGYRAERCMGWEAARDVIVGYLADPELRRVTTITAR